LQFLVTPGGMPCARHEREIADALGVVGADDRVRRGVARAVAELPDGVATWVDLDHPVVELIGDEDVARVVEAAPNRRHRAGPGARDETRCSTVIRAATAHQKGEWNRQPTESLHGEPPERLK